VDVLLRLQADAGADECNPREYWRLKDDEPARLLAVDCDEQRSAEEAAAATTTVLRGLFVVDYVEFQASDRCERYQARLDLTSLAVVSEVRREGLTDGRGCHLEKRIPMLARKGDGASGRPILRLHTEWVDGAGAK
jgi:hypothetical protein